MEPIEHITTVQCHAIQDGDNSGFTTAELVGDAIAAWMDQDIHRSGTSARNGVNGTSLPAAANNWAHQE